MDITQFIDGSYSSFHTVANVVAMLDKAGFVSMDNNYTVVKRGGKYYATNNGSSIIAFVVGEGDGYNIALSHTDSPCLRIKGNTVVSSNGYNAINVEQYGGLLRYSYLDRQLRIAGRVLVDGNCGVESKLVVSNYNVVVPSLAIHHNSTANSALSLSVSRDMLPLLGDFGGDLYATLTSDKVLDADLFVVADQPSFVAGVDGNMLCSARLDNLTSVYSSVCALIDSKPQGIAVACCLDNEEIGSDTKQGAQSNWISNLLLSVSSSLGYSVVEHNDMLRHSFAVSIDNGHALHPAHPEKYDSKQCVKLGDGVVIKHNSRYATDGLSSAIMVKLCNNAGVKTQHYYNHSDLPSGGTLGSMIACKLAMAVCDIGIAQLAMHSACETADKRDITTMTKAITELYNSSVLVNDNAVTIK